MTSEFTQHSFVSWSPVAMTRLNSTILAVLLMLLASGLPALTFAQRQKKIHYALIPAKSHAAGPNDISIIATTAAFRIDKKNGDISTVSFAPYFPMPDHTGAVIRSNLLFGHWRLMGDLRSLYYPQYTWGLHGTPESEDRLLINYKYFRLYETLFRKLDAHFYAGVGYHLDAHVDMDVKGDSSRLRDYTHYSIGTGVSEHSLSSGLSLNVLYDDRLGTGYYGHIAYRVNPGLLGSYTEWHSLYLDFRKYITLNERQGSMLAFWSFFWTVLNGPAPYLDLPSIGWDPYQQRSARGFPQNRFRGNSLLYGESEYRSSFYAHGHLGFVGFVNLNSVSEPNTDNFSYFHPAAGGGIRLKFSKVSTAKIAIDCAFSDGYTGIYLNLGDTF